MTKKEKREKFTKAVQAELKENRRTFLVYSILRVLVILMMVLQLFNQNYENVFVCILTLILMIVPSVLQVTFRVEFPSTLEIIILLFIFSAEILGEIQSFYIHFPYWDTILHILNGFVCAALGMSLVEILNKDKRIPFQMSPFFFSRSFFLFFYDYRCSVGVFRILYGSVFSAGYAKGYGNKFYFYHLSGSYKRKCKSTVF